ncbi:MAG: YqaA family protein, partial [Nitrososphaerales archaeon]
IAEDALEWGKDIFLPLGETGLFIIAFVESSVFPIPPDIVLIPLVLFTPSLGLYYASVSTIGSVLGGIAGYYIGLKGGRPLARKLFSESKIKRVESYFEKYGAWAVLIAAFTPIPYKVFTIASGIVRLDLKRFTIASVIGRGARFFAEAIVIMVWGEQLLQFLLQYFEIITLIIGGAIVGVAVILRKMRKKSRPEL